MQVDVVDTQFTTNNIKQSYQQYKLNKDILTSYSRIQVFRSWKNNTNDDI